MNTSTHCPVCRTAIPADAPGGICPSCALLGVAQPTMVLPPQGIASREEVAAAFPDLEVMEMIGQGGMGVVFKARQPRLDRLVALKILPPHLAAQPGFSERFTREARALAKLHHPNIVTVFDFGESGGFFYLLMEFVNGVNLRKAMQAGVKPEQAMLLVPRICEALQFAHDHGVLHRDIKPENILLDTSGTPKLADFGIAKLADDKNSGLTLSGAALGTASYMAPEQIEKPATVDHRADIYSLGVVFYEMLTGELPLGRFAVPSEKVAVSEGVDAVVMRALEKERERRQQSAGEMKTQVEQATAGACHVRAAAEEDEGDDDPAPSGIKHLLGILTALSGIGIPAAAVVPGMKSLGLTPSVMVFVCAAFGVLATMWPGGSPRRRNPRILTRGSGSESRSPRTLFGYPLYHIVHGPDPATGRQRVARGIIAIGGEARGFLAIGGRAHGVIALGGFATGGVAFGGIAAGLLTAGGLSLGLLAATGGMACGGLARGGVAIGYNVEGGIAIGHIARGGQVITDAPGPPDQAALLATDYLCTAALSTGAVVVMSGLLLLVLSIFASSPSPAVSRQRHPQSSFRFLMISLMLLAIGAGVFLWKRLGGFGHSRDGAGNYQSSPAVNSVTSGRPPFATTWDKGSAELVAVSHHPSTNGPWWQMNGQPALEGPFIWPGGEASAGRGERACEFFFRLRDLPAGVSSPAWLIEHARAFAGGGAPALRDNPGTPLPGYLAFSATLPDSIDRTNIKLGLAAGKWRTISTSSPQTFMGTEVSHEGIKWQITHGTAVETKDGALAVTSSSSRHTDWQSRIVAVSLKGEDIPTEFVSRVNEQTEWRFPSLTISSVKEFRFQVRRMEWIEFRGIALAPVK